MRSTVRSWVDPQTKQHGDVSLELAARADPAGTALARSRSEWSLGQPAKAVLPFGR